MRQRKTIQAIGTLTPKQLAKLVESLEESELKNSLEILTRIEPEEKRWAVIITVDRGLKNKLATFLDTGALKACRVKKSLKIL